MLEAGKYTLSFEQGGTTYYVGNDGNFGLLGTSAANAIELVFTEAQDVKCAFTLSFTQNGSTWYVGDSGDKGLFGVATGPQNVFFAANVSGSGGSYTCALRSGAKLDWSVSNNGTFGLYNVQDINFEPMKFTLASV
ncbi:MAG: hypothetical protein AB8B56_07770 [Crocinitomicaceae bacterium]